MFISYRKLLCHAHIQAEVARVSILRTGKIDPLLIEVRGVVRESVPELHMGRHQNLFRQSVIAPKQEAVGNLTGQRSDQVLLHHGKWKISQVVTGSIHVTVSVLPHVGKVELMGSLGSDSGGNISLAGLGPSRGSEHEGILILDNLRL